MIAGDSSSVLDIFDPMDAGTLLDPFERYQSLQQSCPVAYADPVGLWLVSTYETVRDVLTAPGFSASLAFGRDAVITDTRGTPARQISLRFATDGGIVVSSADGDEHRQLRRSAARCLTRQQLATTEQALARYVPALIRGLAVDQDEIDIATDIARPVAAKAIATLMGMDDSLTQILASWVEHTARTLQPGGRAVRLQGRAEGMLPTLRAFRAITSFYGIQDPPRQSEGAACPGSRSGSAEELVLPVLQLFQAGYETMVPAICYLVRDLLIDRRDPIPSGMAPDTLAAAIEEGVRLASPVRATVRLASARRPVGGMMIPANARMLLLIGAANRDEQVFPEPSRSMPGQRPSHLAFGAGAHRCLGRYLAHLELRHVLGSLMAAAERLELAAPPRPTANFLKAGYASLPVRVRWRPSRP